MEGKFLFYPIDVDFNNHGIIRIFGTTRDGKKICVYDDSLKPYFWILGDKDIEKIKNKIEDLEFEDEFKILNTGIHNKNYLGKEIKAIKVEVNGIKALKFISREVKNDPILMIGLRGGNIKKVITWKKFKAPEYVEFVDSESEMIERFNEIIK